MINDLTSGENDPTPLLKIVKIRGEKNTNTCCCVQRMSPSFQHLKKIRGEKYTKVGDVAVCRERDRVCFSFFSAFEKNEKI